VDILTIRVSAQVRMRGCMTVRRRGDRGWLFGLDDVWWEVGLRHTELLAAQILMFSTFDADVPSFFPCGY